MIAKVTSRQSALYHLARDDTQTVAELRQLLKSRGVRKRAVQNERVIQEVESDIRSVQRAINIQERVRRDEEKELAEID